MQQKPTRWLMSRLKTSGSKRRYVVNGRAADDRHRKTTLQLEELPKREGIKDTRKLYNGKINTNPLERFLRYQVGADWDAVYAEILARIPTRLLDYREIIFWFVARDVEVNEGGLWDKTRQRYIWTDGLFEPKDIAHRWQELHFIEFYVDPATNQLRRIAPKSVVKAIAQGRPAADAPAAP